MLETVQTILQKSWQQLHDQAIHLLPGLLAGLVILLLGVLLGWIARRVADRLLRAAQLDRSADRWGLSSSLERIGIISTGNFLARAFQWSVILLGLMLALYSLNPSLASDLLLRFFLYLPHLIVAALILCAGTMLSRFLARSVLLAAVNAQMSAARLLSGLTRVGVVLVAVAVAFEHLGIGRTTVLVAFSILFGAAMLAAALALGLGSQELVRRWLAERFSARPGEEKQETIHHW